MKKITLALTVAAALSVGMMSTSTVTAAVVSPEHTYITEYQYKYEPKEKHTVYKNGQWVECEFGDVYVRVVTECVEHTGEISYGQWYKNGETHSVNH